MFEFVRVGFISSILLICIDEALKSHFIKLSKTLKRIGKKTSKK